MATPTDIKYIVVDPEVLGGRPSIAGHRIGVIHIATWTQQGLSPEEIATEYGLSLAEVHAALAYYYDHQEELEHQATEDDARLAEYAVNDHSPLAERLREELRTRLAQIGHEGEPPASGGTLNDPPAPSDEDNGHLDG